MANNYCLFSDMVYNLKEKEIAWIKDILQDPEDMPEEEAELWCETYWEGDEDRIPEYWPGFSWAIENDGGFLNWWIYSEEGGNLENVAKAVGMFLARFRPTETFTLTWAATCSKPRIGEFSGGVLAVSALSTLWMNADCHAIDMAKQLQAELKGEKK